MTAKDMRKAEAIKRLKDLFAQGGKRLSFVRVGPSSFRVWLLTDEIRAMLTPFIATACGYRYNSRASAEALIVPGTGHSKQGDVLERLSHATGLKLDSYEDL